MILLQNKAVKIATQKIADFTAFLIDDLLDFNYLRS